MPPILRLNDYADPDDPGNNARCREFCSTVVRDLDKYVSGEWTILDKNDHPIPSSGVISRLISNIQHFAWKSD